MAAADDLPGASPEQDEVLAANATFYEAFEARDLDAMSDVWEHSDRVVCTHPGWRTLRGWGEVGASWFALFRNPSTPQFILTQAVAELQGDLAWVTLDENLIGSGAGQTVAATNVFVRGDDGTWRMVLHHGSPVADQPGPG
jgi:ketosteroid isomerase-like protein